jgi:hypothetical protein
MDYGMPWDTKNELIKALSANGKPLEVLPWLTAHNVPIPEAEA